MKKELLKVIPTLFNETWERAEYCPDIKAESGFNRNRYKKEFDLGWVFTPDQSRVVRLKRVEGWNGYPDLILWGT